MKNAKRIKDKKIRIFSEHSVPGGLVKHYIHARETHLNAYVRQLSANEQYQANAIQDGSAIQFVINKRKIQTDMFVEFHGKTYQMGPPDNFEFYNAEIKFIAYEVTPRQDYVDIEWE